METMQVLLALEQCQMTYNLGKYNDAISAAIELIQQQGERLAVLEQEWELATADKQFREMIKILEKEFERAKTLEFVNKPLAYALYKVWRKVNAGR